MKRLTGRKRLVAGTFDVLAWPAWQLARHAVTRPARDGDPQRILVVELWRLGDIALATPALRALRRRFPQASIALLAPPVAEELLRHSGLVDEVIAASLPWTAETRKYDPARYDRRALRALVSGLRAKRFDLALSARMDLRDHVLMALSGAPRRVGYAYGGGGFLLTDALPPSDGHRVMDWLALTRHIGAPGEGHMELRVTDEERAGAARWLASRGIDSSHSLCGIHLGASSPVRQWGAERFAEVAQRLADGGQRVLVFDPEGKHARQFSADVVVAANTSVREFLALLTRCRLLVCNDSGPMHIAAALGVPTVALFTSQWPQWYAPYGAQHRVALVPGFTCRGCFDRCIYGEPYCRTTLGVDLVWPLVRDSLSARGTSQTVPQS